MPEAAASPSSKRPSGSSGSGSGRSGKRPSGSGGASGRSGGSGRSGERPSGGGSGSGGRQSSRPPGVPSGSESGSKKSGDNDLLSRSRAFRRDILTPSGGWLNDIVVGASSVTGVSDFFLLGMIFVGAWVVLRLTEREVSLVLGLGFDLTIPLQHSMSGNKVVTDRHTSHLEQYWPIFFMGTALEFGCLFLVHPTLFTLVVCLKTAVCTTVWFAQGSNLGPPPKSTSRSARPSGRSNPAPTPTPGANPESTSRPPSAGSGKDKENKKKMQDAIVKQLREHGFKSGTACNMLARKICKEKTEGDMQKKLKAMVGASEGEKAKMEKDAKAEYEKMKAARG